MKSEHRHELKTNELERIASDLGHASERYVQTHTNQLIAVAVVLVAIVIAPSIGACRPARSIAKVGGALSDAGSTADYGNRGRQICRQTKVCPLGASPRRRTRADSGIRLLFTDRDAGRSDLKKAEENFEKLIAEKLTPPEVVERALFGLGRCQESLPGEKTRVPRPSTIVPSRPMSVC